MINENLENYKCKLEKEVSYYRKLITSKRFLNGEFKLQNYFIVKEIDIAINLYESDDYIEGYSIYRGLLQKVEYSGYIPYDENVQNKIRELWRTVDEELWGCINDALVKKNHGFSKLNEFIYVDFLSIIAYKALNEKIDEEEEIFLEKQIEVYRNGGFPCGWRGEFPKGEMVVYSPK